MLFSFETVVEAGHSAKNETPYCLITSSIVFKRKQSGAKQLARSCSLRRGSSADKPTALGELSAIKGFGEFIDNAPVAHSE